MADININQLTNATTGDNGSGVFDLLMVAVENHITEQYEGGRITGNDFATVYLGAMQAVLQQSVQFLMEEQAADKKAELLQAQIDSETKNSETGGVIDLQKQKLQEEIDLVIAKTAESYENITASRQDTVRKNLINSKQAIKIDKDTELVITQNTELGLNGVVERAPEDRAEDRRNKWGSGQH